MLFDRGDDPMSIMTIAVVDGQGGGVGKALVEKLRQAYGGNVHILALGANSLATSVMLKAGADAGATGENAVVVNAGKADVVMGALGIVSADAMCGEITPAMACAVGRSAARKILVPVNKCNLSVAGVRPMQFGEYVAEAVALASAERENH